MPRLRKARKLSKEESRVSQLLRMAIRTGYALRVELIIPPGDAFEPMEEEDEASKLPPSPPRWEDYPSSKAGKDKWKVDCVAWEEKHDMSIGDWLNAQKV